MEVRNGQVWRNNNSGKVYRVHSSCNGFAELVGVNSDPRTVDLETYAGWKTKRHIVKFYTYCS